MTKRNRWPDHAENARMDVIALTLDMEVLQIRLEEALRRGDIVEAAKRNVDIAIKRQKIKHLMQEAKRP